MKLSRTLAFVAVILVMFAVLAVAWANPPCGVHADMLKEFKAKFKEEPSVWGLTGLGALFEILVSEKGTWTVLVTSPQTMLSCVVASGTDWVGDDHIPGEDA